MTWHRAWCHDTVVVGHGIADALMTSYCPRRILPKSRCTMHLASEDGSTATLVTMPDGEGYLMSVRLPRLEEGRTYQLRAFTD